MVKVISGKSFQLCLSDVNYRHRLKYKDHPIHTGWESGHDYSEQFGYLGGIKSRKVFNSIVVDLLIASRKNVGLSYSRGSEYYRHGKAGILGYKSVLKVINFLVDENLVLNFIAPAGTNVAQTSFMYATDLLISECSTTVAPERFRECPEGKTVLYKDRGSQKYIKPPEGDIYQMYASELVAQNAFLAEFEYGLSNSMGNKEYPLVEYKNSKHVLTTVNASQVSQSRNFLVMKGADMELVGGRYYGGFWRGMSKESRACITINGEQVGEELDYSCLHLQIAYAKVGDTLKDDGYAVPIKSIYVGGAFPLISLNDSQTRKIVKSAVLIAMNAKSLTDAKGALVTKIAQLHPNLLNDYFPSQQQEISKKIIQSVKLHHRVISDFFCSDCGVQFQFDDSEIMTIVQRRCREKDIPVLGVHDSVLYPESRKSIVESIFLEELEAYLEGIRFVANNKGILCDI